MIVLDANVVSAMIHFDKEPVVIKWIDRQKLIDLYIPTPVMFEISYGLNCMNTGKTRTLLESRYSQILLTFFGTRIVGFDAPAAETAAGIYAGKPLRGRKELVIDIQIAGIAVALGAIVATRNVKDFERLGVKMINPWGAGG